MIYDYMYGFHFFLIDYIDAVTGEVTPRVIPVTHSEYCYRSTLYAESLLYL